MDDRGPFISATEVVGNIGVSTAPGVDPAFVVVEVTLMGTAATPDPTFPQEAGVRTRVEGFTTDPTRTVESPRLTTIAMATLLSASLPG